MNYQAGLNYSPQFPFSHGFYPLIYPPYQPEGMQFVCTPFVSPLEPQYNCLTRGFPEFNSQIPQTLFPSTCYHQGLGQIRLGNVEQNPSLKIDDTAKCTVIQQQQIHCKRDRNIKSNALKLYLKYTRRDLKMRNGYHSRLLEKVGLQDSYSLKQFDIELNKALPMQKNYIKTQEIREICLGQNEELTEKFIKMLRISLNFFFKQTIYLFNSKYTRTKKRVRRQQIKAGLKILQEIFSTNLPEE